MESLITGSIWLSMTAAVVGPFMALLIGFVSTDRLLRWQPARERERTPPESTEGLRTNGAGRARLVRFSSPGANAKPLCRQ
jgi:hypothetical protein